MGVDWWISDAIKDKSAASGQRINIHVAELRAEVNRLLATLPHVSENVEQVLSMMRRCQKVDEELIQWAKNLPPSFNFKTVAWEDHVPNGDYTRAEVFPGRIDAYQDLWIASVWNMMRCCRIIVASMIVRCAAWIASPLDYRTTPEYAACARTCVETITDIIASVPYQLGWFAKRKHLLESVQQSAFGCGEEDAEKGLPGYFLTWPLTCITGQDYATEDQRAWAMGRLDFIGNQLGVRYAHMLTKVRVLIFLCSNRLIGCVQVPLPPPFSFSSLLLCIDG